MLFGPGPAQYRLPSVPSSRKLYKLCQNSGDPPNLPTVLQPPTQELVGGWVGGGKQNLNSMKQVFGIQQTLVRRLMVSFKSLWNKTHWIRISDVRRWSLIICIYNTLSRTISVHTRVCEAGQADARDLFIHLPPPSPPKRTGKHDFEFLRTIMSCPLGALSEDRAGLALGLTRCRTSVLVTNDPARPSLAAVCLQAP